MDTHKDQYMALLRPGEKPIAKTPPVTPSMQRWFNSEVRKAWAPPAYLFLGGLRINQLPHQNNPNSSFPSLRWALAYECSDNAQFLGQSTLGQLSSRNLGITIHNVT
ncbi:hypothetical protein E2I00_007427 [Balaenoptera physalus]|uniref:Uncharacterized protein n=1 Tax=Balaenoptera physalus TaxID=9770 RepID=A0A6A1PZR9_BALPH|nr:hypothetical protein E2I00_007427 [Balaenoptera physalus]